ncbi:MAG: CBS domain-containing protein [Candidatus Xenobia bacterium]
MNRRLMLEARIHRVLVTNGREIYGIVTTMDLVRLLPDVLHELARR